MGVVWAEFVTTLIFFCYHIKEIGLWKAWGGRYAERAWGEHCICVCVWASWNIRALGYQHYICIKLVSGESSHIHMLFSFLGLVPIYIYSHCFAQ